MPEAIGTPKALIVKHVLTSFFGSIKLHLLTFMFFAGLIIYSDVARNNRERICLSILGAIVVQIILDFKNTLTFCKVFFLTARRDFTGLSKKIYFEKCILPWAEKHKMSPARILAETAKLHPYKTAIIQAETGEKWSFHEMNEYCNGVANYFLKNSGIKTQETIAIIADNRIEYGPLWLGLNRAGYIPALINYKLTGDGLKHCLDIVNSKAVIVLSEFLDDFLDCGITESNKTIQIYELTVDDKLPSIRKKEANKTDDKKIINLTKELKQSCKLAPENAHIPKDLSDTILYIYTSGTTGLPKAARVSMTRYCIFGYITKSLYNIGSDNIFYNTLPLYHSNGGLVVLTQTVINGCTIIVRKKFSATAFWDDIVKYQATSFNYIGEICRFLLAKPVTPTETSHNLKFIIGNGLKPEIWREFCDRFQIPWVCEFYGATEGVANLANYVNKEGSVGFITKLVPILFPIMVAKVDQETEEFVRDPETGLVELCAPNEVGMIIGRVELTGIFQFSGYHDKKQNTSKYLFDVNFKGDVYFKTGDLVVQDELGFIKFKDRTGDTFRWKGENCSTAEVDAVTAKIINNNDITIACVSCHVPGNEGNAGLLVLDNSAISEQDKDEYNVQTVKQLADRYKVELPSYQIPVFLRITNKIEVTSTFKIQKAKVKKLGYDLAQLPATDQIYVYQRGNYVKVDDDLFEKIQNKQLRF